MREVFICDAIRTPIGRFGGGLSTVRADDLAALPIKALIERNPSVDWSAVDEVFLGCANQAGEDNRNVARMALLLAGLPESIPGVTLNRLCASGMDAIGTAFRAIASGEMELAIAGGVESMSRAPFVMGKADAAFSRNMKLEDTTIGWRFINPLMKAQYGVDAMPQTADNVADDYQVSRADQDAFALRSQQRTAAAQAAGFFAEEIVPVRVVHKKGETVVEHDEHPRDTHLEALAKLKPVNGPDNTVTAGNSSGVNDGAAALILASAEAVKKHGLTARARVLGMASAAVAPRVMGMGPVPAVRKLVERLGLAVTDFDVIELNEAFASQGLAVLRELGIADDAPQVNPNGGAIALGHPLGMSGARLVLTALHQLEKTGGRKGLATMCVGVGQGLALAIERI
ncbi:3-oxoadipyl-CoA thiolase [Pseudomonas grimontii]|uniref:Beta-ketoadipyl-CoA thiolase n=2 Tax=Pseudomonas TaxID=286 RepID=A0A1H1IPN2_9PSED|nr:3-oxoadipyl-CoA thiolase [Pseudomonas grimontii]TWR70437.1 3-oxoadipyl-CoA thiolase [Pseudomonas grimontii]SDR39685.1 3-oxoadipyl-CoA thiolase [Pseudomonas grimontii]